VPAGWVSRGQRCQQGLPRSARSWQLPDLPCPGAESSTGRGFRHPATPGRAQLVWPMHPGTRRDEPPLPACARPLSPHVWYRGRPAVQAPRRRKAGRPCRPRLRTLMTGAFPVRDRSRAGRASQDRARQPAPGPVPVVTRGHNVRPRPVTHRSRGDDSWSLRSLPEGRTGMSGVAARKKRGVDPVSADVWAAPGRRMRSCRRRRCRGRSC
jgi:hypothetical protein